MFGNSVGELANLVTMRSFTQAIFSICVVVGMFWPVARPKIVWSLALVVMYVGVVALGVALNSNNPAWTALYGIATSAGISLHHAALLGFSGARPNYLRLTAPPALCLALATLALAWPAEAMLGVYLINTLQLVALAYAAMALSADRSHLAARLLLAAGCAMGAGSTLFQAVTTFVAPERFILAYGIMGLGTAMAMIMQNMGWLALLKDNAELQLDALAHRDGLTGLLNRRGFARDTQRTLKSLRRHNRPAAVLLIDIDHFKVINDSWGHQVGDDVLAAVGRLLGKQVSSTSVGGRLGGEEFALLLGNVDPMAAHRAGERLRDAMSDDIRLPDFSIVRFSAGVSAVHPGETDLDAAIARADKALYQAKASGRDCIIIAASSQDLMAA